jgi:excisionase family DNA binding protein
MPRSLGKTIFYTPDEVATIINRHYDTALRHIKAGFLRAEFVNHGYLVPHDELVKYLDEEFALPEEIIDLRLGRKPVGRP